MIVMSNSLSISKLRNSIEHETVKEVYLILMGKTMTTWDWAWKPISLIFQLFLDYTCSCPINVKRI